MTGNSVPSRPCWRAGRRGLAGFLNLFFVRIELSIFLSPPKGKKWNFSLEKGMFLFFVTSLSLSLHDCMFVLLVGLLSCLLLVSDDGLRPYE